MLAQSSAPRRLWSFDYAGGIQYANAAELNWKFWKANL
jgi:hypothetical protein